MVFVNDKQRKACFVKMNILNKEGKVSSWDCYKYAKGESKSSSKKSSHKKKSEKIFTGPKGGKYIIRRNKKVYI